MTSLLHMCSGIAAGSGGSGFEMDQEDAITLVQLVVSKCLDREILCNELYLQLIKQTTDQPGDPVSNCTWSGGSIKYFLVQMGWK